MALNYTDTDGRKYRFDDSQEQAVLKLYDEVKRLRLLLGARTEIVVQELLREIETMSSALVQKEVKLREAEARAASVVDATIKYLDS